MQSLVDDLKLGLGIAVRNWPLLLISIAEGILALALLVGALLVVAAPFVVGAIRGTLPQIEKDPGKIAEWILTNPFLILNALLAVLVALVIATVVHAFVEAGRIAIYESSRAQGGTAVFTPELWMEEGQKGWLTLFLIYNAVWGLYSLLFLIPAVVILFISVAGQNTVILIAGCLAMLVFFCAAVVLGIGCFLWSKMSSIAAIVGRLKAVDALTTGKQRVRELLGPLIASTVVLFVLSASISSFIGVFAFMFDLLSKGEVLGTALLPVRIALQLVQSAISVVFSCWLIAAMVVQSGRARRNSYDSNRNIPLR